MQPIPPECRPLADEVAALEARLEALHGEAMRAVGLDAWKKLAELATMPGQLDRRRAELSSCVRAHSGALQCELVVMDVAGRGALGDRVAHLWDMSGPGPTLRETVPVLGAGFSFAGPLPVDMIGITVAPAAAGPGKWPDFRSGAVPAPPPDSPQLRLELVFGPIVTVTDEDLSRWLSGVTIPAQSIDLAGWGTVQVSVGTVAGTFVPSALRLTVGGTLSFPAVMVQDSPFSASAGVGLVPSASPDALLPAELTIVIPPTVEFAGPLAAFGPELSLALSTGLFDLILAQLRPIIARELAGLVGRAFSLLHLPPLTVSIREIAIEPPALTFQPALGAVGTALSTFEVDPQLVVPP
jgi:hypothetical protein